MVKKTKYPKTLNVLGKEINLIWIIAVVLVGLVLWMGGLIPFTLMGEEPVVVSKWSYGPTESVSVSGNRLYANAGDVLMIFDVSNPNNLNKLKEITGAGLLITGGPQVGQYLASNNKMAVVCQGSRGATLVDASSFESIKLDLGKSIDSAVFRGDILFLSAGHKIVSLDVSNPLDPHVIESTAFGCSSLVVEGDYLYAHSTGVLGIYDISNPLSIQYISSYACGGTIWDIDVLNDVVYVARNLGSSAYHSVHLIDVSNKNTPTALGTYISPAGNAAKKIVVMNTNYLLVTEHDHYVEVVDIADKSSPTRVATVGYTHGYPRDITKIDDTHFAVGVHYRGVDIFDFTNPLSVQKTNYLIGTGRTKAAYVDPYTKIGYLLDDMGLRVIDFGGDVAEELSFMNWGSRGSSIEVVDNIAYCCVTWGGLKIVDVSNPTNPITLTDYNPTEYINSIKIIGNYAYMNHFSSIRLFDITDKSSIVELSSSKSFGKSFWGWTVVNDLLYVANYDDGFYIYDWSDVNNPPILLSKSTYGIEKGCSVKVRGDIAYVQDYYKGFKVLDVSDKHNPVKIGEYTEYHMNPRGADWVIHDDLVYLTGQNGISVVDVSTPSTPTLVRYMDIGGSCSMYGNLFGVISGGTFTLFEFGGVSPSTTTTPTSPVTTSTTVYQTPSTTLSIPSTTTSLTTSTTIPTPPDRDLLSLHNLLVVGFVLLVLGGFYHFMKSK